ncbi:hypothetical protein CBR_g8068 [Chara braunii]|uniref:Uncharacterized protein n=1 Tax=Chara braunii TaxID=69332 RepID=A0A388KL42_CHABU|nr:hypothetical protein CBR_g8068 [Chara braunii]|eukprot:GBG70770.1 hypothetical protein CBR_g8068 [Chara braunii]
MYGHFARRCPYPPRNNGYVGSPRADGYVPPRTGGNEVPIQGRPILPPPPPQVPNQAAAIVAPPAPILQAPPMQPPASNAIVPYQPTSAIQYQPPRGTTTANGGRGWTNRPREGNGEGEGLMILREILNERREDRERRREEDDRHAREEQARLAREEEERRLQQEENREAEREARLTRIVREQMEELEAKKKEDASGTNKSNRYGATWARLTHHRKMVRMRKEGISTARKGIKAPWREDQKILRNKRQADPE